MQGPAEKNSAAFCIKYTVTLKNKGSIFMEQMIKKNKNLFIAFLSIAIPIGLQNLLTYGVNLMDSIMVGSLSEVELSAVTVATQPFYLFMTFMMGVTSGAGVLIAQYWGKNDKNTISKVFGIVIQISLITGLFITAIVLFFPRQVMSLYTPEEQVIEYGVQYLRVVVFSYLPFAFTNGYIACVRNVERVKIAVVTYSVSFAVNVFFNYAFIFGKFGAPAMGVAGAGVGTVVARYTELAIVLFYALKMETRVKLEWQTILHSEKWLLGDYIKLAVPVVINEMLWAVGTSVHNAILGRMEDSVTALTTVSIVTTAYQVATVFIYGAASATLVLVGKQIGEKNFDEARQTAKKLVMACIGIAVITATVFLLSKNGFMSFYTISPETHEALNNTMFVAAAMILIFSINMACIVGVFRGGGDTKFAMYLDIFSVWCVAIPLGMVGAFAWKLPIPAVYFLLRFDEVVKAFLCFFHFRSGKWLKVVTRNRGFQIEMAKEG